MAEINILLQGLEQHDDHETAVNQLLQLPDIDQYLFSLAFVRSNGVDKVSDNLKNVSDKIKIFIGIRNGITSIQAVFSLFKIGIEPYVVDTADTNKIFHPKIYAAYGDERANIILGSANLTYNGLNQNIEASSYIKLDRNIQADEEYLIKLVKLITNMPTAYPDHVFQVSTPRQAVQLLREGRLEDERLTRLPSSNQPKIKKERDKLKSIPTFGRRNRKIHKGIKKRRPSKSTNTAVLVWESKPLTARSLNIPRGSNTHSTGDANLGLGLMEDIDFQHYFRDVVFSSLPWKKDPASISPYLERAHANIELVIKNISYGVFELEVTHDPRTNTRSYEQRNVMTKIKWGEARSLIAKNDLLDRTLRLYTKGSNNFVIVID